MNLNRLLLLLPLAGFVSCSTNPVGAPQGADFHSGMWRLSGDIGHSSNGNGTVNGDATQLGGSIGFFVTDAIEIGLGGDFETINKKQSEEDMENAFLSVFSRYYTTGFGATRPFVEMGVGFGTTSLGPLEEDLNVFSGTFGVVHFLSQDWALEFAVEKSFYQFPNSTAINTASWSGSVGVSWFF